MGVPGEDELLAAVRALTVTDPSPDPESDELLRYVARVCNVRHAVLALIGRSRLWFKSRLGVEASEAPLFALPPDLEVIEDVGRDPRGPGDPLLALVPGTRFLAIAPLHDGPVGVGALVIMDRKLRHLPLHQADALRSAASVAVGMLKLRHRVRLLEALLESSPDRFYAFDTRGRYVYASERGARAMGLSSAQMLGRTWQELGWDPGYTSQFSGMFRLALTTGQLVEDARAVSTPGGLVHHEYALAPLRGPRGEIEGVAVTARDVTARVAAEAERRAAEADRNELLQTAQQALRQRDDVLAVVSHDLRNLLNIFRAATALLSDEVPEEASTARGWVTMLQRQAEAMNRLVDDLVDVGRIDARSLRIVRARCDARALAQEAMAAVQPLAQQNGIAIEVDLPEPGVLVHCDRGRVLQVFANVLGNAVKFTQQGAVRLEVSAGESEVRFSISDTGPGISPEHLPHLFERYWQARHGGRTGAGLGLYISRGIIEAHGGRIAAESTLGKGTTIAFTLPRSQPAP